MRYFCYGSLLLLVLAVVFILWFTYYMNDISELSLGSWMTTCLGNSCSFDLPRVPFVNCCQFMKLVISLLVLRVGYGIWLYQFLIIAYLFTLVTPDITWDDYRTFRNKTRQLIRHAERKYFSETVDNCKDTEVLWRHLRTVTTGPKLSINNLPAERVINNERISNSENIASKLNEYFASVTEQFKEYISGVQHHTKISNGCQNYRN